MFAFLCGGDVHQRAASAAGAGERDRFDQRMLHELDSFFESFDEREDTVRHDAGDRARGQLRRLRMCGMRRSLKSGRPTAAV